MSRPISYTSAVTVNPVSYNSSSTLTASTSYPAINGCDGTGSTTYARFTCSTTSQYAIYDFDITEVPSIATINSVSCVIKAYINNTSRVTTRTVQLYTNNTAKGSATTITGTSAENYTLTPGTWTKTELSDIKLRITGQRNSSSSQNGYIYFYGADLTVNYSINGTAYEVTTTSTYTGATATPASQEIFSGGTGVVRIDVDDINNIVVEDNGTDVTDQLVAKPVVTSGSSETVLGKYTLLSGSFNGQGASYFQGLVGKGVGSTQTTSNYYSSSSGTIAGFTYNLIFSNIPSNATITRLYCQVNGHAESTSQSNEYMCVQLILGTTATTLSEELNFKSIGTSNSTQTLEATTLPTVEQLPNLKLYCRLGYYGGAINGATCYVEYTLPDSGNPYYYEYTINNINADHTILVSESIYIPPEEDPDKTYYSVTISSINATTDPKRGTTRVESGTSETITITPSDPQLTLALDNGVDITSQLVPHGTQSPTSAVTTAAGASYGFNYNAQTGYYVSANQDIDKTAAVCVVNFNLPVRSLITIQYINYAEQGYDFGVFGNTDIALNNNYYEAGSDGATITDSNYKLACNTSTYNSSSPQTITYEIQAGEHSVYIKYSKDDATSNNNDTLQFKVLSIEELEPSVGYYSYDLNNVNQQHNLIFIFGDVTYYFVTSSTNSNAKLNPDGQMVILPDDEYRLTIVPENINDTISLTDNNVDVTGNLVRKEEIIEKGGQRITVVNYIYTLMNVQTGHTLYVTSSSASAILYYKSSNTWGQVRKAYQKINDRWQEVSDLESLFESGTIYVNK